MYFYIFDPQGEKETHHFERSQGRLLNLLAENRIEGEEFRVTAIRTVELLVEQAVSMEAKTIIVVGGDASLDRTVNALVKQNADITLGFIPLQQHSSLAGIFGMPDDIEQAVKILAGRLVKEVDLGTIGEHCFLSSVYLGENQFKRINPGFLGLGSAQHFLKMKSFQVQVAIENSFSATAEVLGVQIINCRNNEGGRLKLGNPNDSLLDIVMLNKLTRTQIFRYRDQLASGCLENVPGSTVMHAKKINILGPKKLSLSVEGRILTKAPASVEVGKRRVKIICGKTRQF